MTTFWKGLQYVLIFILGIKPRRLHYGMDLSHEKIRPRSLQNTPWSENGQPLTNEKMSDQKTTCFGPPVTFVPSHFASKFHKS